MGRRAGSKAKSRRRDRRAARRVLHGTRAQYAQNLRSVMAALRSMPRIPMCGDDNEQVD